MTGPLTVAGVLVMRLFIVAGGRVITSAAGGPLADPEPETGIAAAATSVGNSAISNGDPLAVGVIGHYVEPGAIAHGKRDGSVAHAADARAAGSHGVTASTRAEPEEERAPAVGSPSTIVLDVIRDPSAYPPIAGWDAAQHPHEALSVAS